MAGMNVPAYPPPLPPPRHDTSPPADGGIVDVRHLPYYHPNLKSMDQVKELLSEYTKRDGSFILRNSMSKPGHYTISVIHSGGIKHFNVEISSQKTFFLKDVQFRTMQQLVAHYALNEVPNREQIRNVRLLHPITRSGSALPASPGPFNSPDPDNGVYIDTITSRAALNGPTVPHIRRAASAAALSRNDGPSASSFPHYVANRRASSANEYEPLAAGSQTKAATTAMSYLSFIDDETHMCDCGLLKEESILPRGWTVHISTDPESAGEIYFMAPDGSTHWILPLEVSLELTPDQQDRIRDLIYDFEASSRRTARAKMSPAQPANVAARTNSPAPADNNNNPDYVAPMTLTGGAAAEPVVHGERKAEPTYMPMNGLHMGRK